ncbi:MAG: hypothetical protein UGF38_05495, partial [Ruminococcus sp.]|nr:hypothetical protein [Ruminococcus sp.]
GLKQRNLNFHDENILELQKSAKMDFLSIFYFFNKFPNPSMQNRNENQAEEMLHKAQEQFL